MLHNGDFLKSAGIFLLEMAGALLVFVSQQLVSLIIPLLLIAEGWFLMEVGRRGTDLKQKLGYLPLSLRLKFIPFCVGLLGFGIVLSYNLWRQSAALIILAAAVLTLSSKLMCFRELSMFASKS